MTPDQWKQLAAFAGVEYTGEGYIRFPISGGHYWNKPWNPLTDWSDFGPLWVRLERWEFSDAELINNELAVLFAAFETAKIEGTDRDIMHAGCLLGAKIGATMTTTSAGEKAC